MARKYKCHSPNLKLKVALEATRNEKRVNQIASEYIVHPIQVSEWKKMLTDGAEVLFQNKKTTPGTREAYENVELFQQQIGKLTVQIDWLKKSLVLPLEERKGGINHNDPALSLNEQLVLAGVCKSSYYYIPVPEDSRESDVYGANR